MGRRAVCPGLTSRQRDKIRREIVALRTGYAGFALRPTEAEALALAGDERELCDFVAKLNDHDFISDAEAEELLGMITSAKYGREEVEA